MEESAGKAWTDDKHCSYLNSIEATFVRSLLKQDYRTVDLSEQDQDCVESRPMDPSYLAYHHGPGEVGLKIPSLPFEHAIVLEQAVGRLCELFC